MYAPSIRFLHPLTVFRYDDAPHGHAEVDFVGVVLETDAVLLGPSRGLKRHKLVWVRVDYTTACEWYGLANAPLQ